MPEPTDHDPFSPFAHFDPEVPMPLSAAAIRRRGDRFRRRNTGLAIAGGVAVIALIATPLALLSGDDDTGALSPSGQDSTTVVEPDNESDSSTGLVTRIPAGFPLDADLPQTNEDGTPVTVDRDVATTDFRLCQDDGFAPGDPSAMTDIAAATSSAPEDYRARLLTVWEDLSSAAAALEDVRDVLSSCEAAGAVYTEEPSKWVGDSVVFSVQYPLVDEATGESFGLSPGLGIIEAVRIENALYLARYDGEGGGSAKAAAAGVKQATLDSSTPVAEAYAVFGANIATDSVPSPTTPTAPTDPGTSDAAPSSSDDLTSFPLALDWPDPNDVEGQDFGLEGPGTDLDPITYPACSRSHLIGDPIVIRLTGESPTGDLRATYSNVEDSRTRELLTFAVAQEAVDFMARAKTFYAGCPEDAYPDEDTAYPHEVVDTEVGGQSFAVINSTEMGGEPVPGLGILQFVRLGRAVLIDTTYGEGLRSGAPAQLDAMSLATANVVAEMCTFTEAGC